MQFAIYGKTLAEESVPYIRNLISKLVESKSSLYFYEPFFQVIKDYIRPPDDFSLFYHNNDIVGEVDVLLSIGGDGTLLDTITLVRNSGIPILGVNLGKLGFLSSISKEEIIQGIDKILHQDYTLDQRTLLRLESDSQLFGSINYAMNDITVSRIGSPAMLIVHTYIDGNYLNSYWGDGLIVSTPTGSTAYSMSCGGPIITPGSEAFVITPVATHNLTVRPVVIPDSKIITLKVEGRQGQFTISLDSRSLVVNGSLELTIRKEEFMINLLKMEGQDFFRTIRTKLNWGVDIRN
ncbi:MAG: NAD kinase [Bacteroidales bacterium]